MRIRLIFSSMIVLACSGPFSFVSAENPYGIPTDADQALRQGFHQLFNLEFEAAEKTLAPLKDRDPNHPLFAFSDVIRNWWWLSVHVLEIDAEKSRSFLAAAEKTLKIAERNATDKDLRGEAHLVMGTTLGLMSRWSAANRAYLTAYLRGKKSANYLKRSLELNPEASDAYMTLGAFNYAKELMRKNARAKKGKTTPREELDLGISQLRKAYDSGTYFREAAGLMLAGILSNTRPKEAIPLIQELRVALPKNVALHMLEISTLYNAGERDRMKAEVDLFRQHVASGTYSVDYQPQAAFAEGLWAFGQKEWEKAIDLFAPATLAPEENPYHAWSLLYQGYAYDAIKDRTKARKNYEAVKAVRRRYASHDHAQYHLHMPFLPDDIQVRKLEL
jgi:tetratricopeptide (TPR) repeat protein